MKLLLIFTLLLPIFRLEAAPDPKIKRFLEMPPSAVSKYLKTEEANMIHGRLIAAAVDARRLDLIEICFKNDGTGTQTVGAVAKIKDLDFQDQVMLMILKADHPSYWWPEDPFQDGSRISLRSYMERFSCVLLRHFPDMPKDGKCFETYAKRLELAKKLEQKIAAEKLQTGEITPPSTQPEPTPQKPGPVRADTASDRAVPAAHERSPWAIGLAVAAIIAFVGVACLRWIRRSRGS